MKYFSNKAYILLLFCVLALFESCGNNLLFFDKNKCAVYVKNGGRIERMYIVDTSEKFLVNVEIANGKSGLDTFYLFRANPDYIYKIGTTGNQSYEFKHHTTYEIFNNSIPDAAKGRIIIYIDSLGNCNLIENVNN